MKKKPFLHNRLVRLWGNPTDDKLKKFYGSHGLFNSTDDAQNLVKYGSYLITKGNKLRLKSEPYDPLRGLNNFIEAIEGEILFYVGVEYFIKGIYLHEGYTINELKSGGWSLIRLKNNKTKLNPERTAKLSSLLDNLPKIINFDDFDKDQAKKNKKDRGKPSKGTLSNNYKHPGHKELLRFIRFNRNVQLHTSKKVPEFRGNIDEVNELLEIVATQSTGKSIKELANLDIVYF